MMSQRHVHFVGVCGTGMAAAAVLMRERGCRVTGSDSGAYPPMSTYLEREGIPFAPTFDPSHLVPPPDLVVIGNAISRGNPEVEEVLDQKIPFISLPELLRKELIGGKRSLVITGTHGKTTCSSLLAWILESSGRAPSFFVGGIPINFGCGIRRAGGSEVVLEGDEYDTAFFDKRPKFLHYVPDLVLINNIEFDHADIYSSLMDVEKAFASLLRLIPHSGRVVANRDDPVVRRVLERTFCPVEWFGRAATEGLWLISDLEPQGDKIAFSVHKDGRLVGRLTLSLMGDHNAINAAGVYVCCRSLGLTHREIETGFRTFQGVRRRLDNRGTFRDVMIFEDFAHHPTAISKTLAAIQSHHPGHPIWAVFEPRSNTTRRNFFQKELAKAFRIANQVIVGAVYKEEVIDLLKREGVYTNFHFLGYRSDVPEILAESDVLCHPAFIEVFPRVILEAMASRLPVISTYAGAIPEMVEDKKTALLVKAGDARTLSEAIGAIDSNMHLRKRMGEAGFQRVKERFSLELHTKKVCELYEKLIGD